MNAKAGGKGIVWAALCVVIVCGSAQSQVQGSMPASGVVVLSGPASVSPLPSGIQLRSDTAVLRVEALSESVVRVRMAASDQLPEDASWAVNSDRRKSSVAVTQWRENQKVGFETHALRVQVDPATLNLSVTDLNGRTLQQDDLLRPVEFHGHAFRLYKTMAPDEHYFGLGDKTGPLDRRGQAFSMWNTDSYAFQESTDPIYKDIPFFMTLRRGQAAGVLFDNTFRSSFDFGRETPVDYSYGAEDGPIDYYILAGPTPKDVLSQYAWLTGFTPLPPMWALGYQQSRSSYYPEARVHEIADRLRADHIPADVVYLDIDYQQALRPFTVDSVRFPHFKDMVSDLRKQDLRIVAITDLHIANLPKAGYMPFDTGAAGDHFVKNPDGSRYVAKVWPGDSVFPDFTRSASRAWWGSLYKRFVDDGVAGFWNDMNEPAIFNAEKTMPATVQHRIEEPGFAARTADHREIHNVYGMENSRATFDGLLKLRPNERPFVLTRASYAGGQQYAWTWTGDNTSTWNHLRMTTPMLLNLGLSGFALSGADVGGFSGTPQAALLTKWFELAAFEPLDRDHTARNTGDQEPWASGPAEEAIRRKFIEERYRLMPYLYTAAEEMSRTGVPIMRPLFVEFPEANKDRRPLDLDCGAEFLFGANLLVAPAPYPDELDKYEVKFPPAAWYDYWTGAKVKDDPSAPTSSGMATPVVIKPQNDVLPVYVRGGSIIPVAPLTQSTMETPRGPLTLRVYPGENCQGSLYLDDGQSFDYKRGSSLRVNFTCAKTSKSLVFHIASREGSFAPWWKELNVEVYGFDAMPRRLTVNGIPLPQSSARLDAASHILRVTLPDSGQEQRLELLF